MDAMSIIFTVVGLVVAVLAFWVQVNSYRLQRNPVTGDPGERVDPLGATRALDDIDEDKVKSVAANHIFIGSQKENVGYIKKQQIGVYLDLHSASCDPKNRSVLAASLAEFVRDELGEASKRSLVATPREGNLLVGAQVAELLRTKYLMIRTVTAPRFGYPIEGSFTPGATTVIVDDLCMEGVFLARCVKYLRRYGMNVSHCVCLFERLDGDARESLASVSVELHSRYQIDDETLKELVLEREARYGRIILPE